MTDRQRDGEEEQEEGWVIWLFCGSVTWASTRGRQTEAGRQRLAISSVANSEPGFEDAAPLLCDKWLCRLAVTASAAEGHTETCCTGCKLELSDFTARQCCFISSYPSLACHELFSDETCQNVFLHYVIWMHQFYETLQ